MSRRVLLFREPLRRRPYGERPLTESHFARRSRTPVEPARFKPLVARRGESREGRLA